jgi:ADP-ribosylglycohydrolase
MSTSDTGLSQHTRRQFIRNAALALPGIYLLPGLSGCATGGDDTFYKKAMGCFMGAAIGDAMGGPIECQHYKRIEKYAGNMSGFLKYSRPLGLMDLNPGYALHPEAGSITDDTYIRMDLARYLLGNDPEYTAAGFAQWLLSNADFSNWWDQAVKILREIEKGSFPAEEAGLHHIQGGGGGWWQPVAIICRGDIQKTVQTVDQICRIWKAPLERDILTAVCAGQAEALHADSSIDSIVDTVLKYSGPLATKLFERTIDIARNSATRDELYRNLYANALVDSNGVTKEIDGPMPPPVEPEEYNDGFYTSITFTEQQPWALAYFVWGQGDPAHTVITAAMGGRDADSIATNTASWLGAMGGIDVWPEEWVMAVQQSNLVDFDLKQTCEDLINKSREMIS